MNFNQVILAGRLVRNPELRYSAKGKTAVCRFSVAVNRSWKTESRETKEEVAFVECDAWGWKGETIAAHFVKGSNILLSGRLKMESYEKDGQKVTKIKVVVETFSFVDKKPALASAAQFAVGMILGEETKQ